MTNTTEQPTTVRRLGTPAAMALADLTSMLDDLHTVLYCCERLVAELDPGTGDPDDLLLEALWTTALLGYDRCFTDAGRGMALTDADVGDTSLRGEVLEWHRVLRQLREHYTSAHNPRERLSVGVAQDADGRPTGVAVTSTRQAALDDVTVRQTGALAYQLSLLVQRRITEQQERVLAAATALSTAELAALPLIDVAAPAPTEEDSDTNG
jgi:hypothetical protein